MDEMSGVSARGGVPDVRHAAEILYMARALIIKLPVLGSHIGIKKASAAAGSWCDAHRERRVLHTDALDRGVIPGGPVRRCP